MATRFVAVDNGAAEEDDAGADEPEERDETAVEDTVEETAALEEVSELAGADEHPDSQNKVKPVSSHVPINDFFIVSPIHK